MDKEHVNSLVKRIKSGDTEAFDELYRGLYRPIYSFIQQIVYDRKAVEDILHNVFVIIIKKSPEKIYYKNCFGWIFTIAKRQAINYNKKYCREVAVEKIEWAKDKIDENNDEKLMLKIAIEELSLEERTLIILRYQEDFTYKMLADAMNTSETSMKRKVKHILNKLEKLIE